MSTPNAERLAEDVVLEILMRLPLKTLVRFKCVCKRWKAIIAGYRFANEHYGRGSNKEGLLIVGRQHNECNRTYMFVDDNLSAFEEPAHLQFPNTVTKVMGAVNGVFCLVGRIRGLSLLNPATRELKPLPRRPSLGTVEPHLCFFREVLGFGMDALSGDFKVVLICCMWDNKATAYHSFPPVFVYSSRSGSWRNVDSFETCYSARSPVYNQYLKGVYYWILGDAGILAFDMSTEKFEKIDVPDCVKRNMSLLTVRDDSLALLTSKSGLKDDVSEIWVMEKEGSWNRVAVVNSFSLPHCFLRNNELVLWSRDSGLTLYSIFTKEMRLPVAAALFRDFSMESWVFSYQESLLSIRGEGDNCVIWDGSTNPMIIA